MLNTCTHIPTYILLRVSDIRIYTQVHSRERAERKRVEREREMHECTERELVEC